MGANNKIEVTGLPEALTAAGSDKLIGIKSGSPHLFSVNLLKSVTWCGRRWNVNNSTPVAADAVGNLDMLANLASVLGLGCYLVDDGHNRQKLNPSNHNKLATGETVALDGTNGQYMWGTGTDLYYADFYEGDYYYEIVSTQAIPGRMQYHIPVFSTSALGAGVMDRTNLKLCSIINSAAQYRGGNGSAISSGSASSSILSQLGYPATSIAISQFEVYGRARGEGWGAGWAWINTIIGALMRIVFGNRNIQAAYNANRDANGLYQGGLGSGVSGLGSWDTFNGYFPVIPTSAGVSMGDGVGVYTHNVLNSSGGTHYAAPVPVFFGLKNHYGHLWRGLNRIIGVKQADKSYKFYVAKSSRSEWNYSDTANMLYVGQTPPGTGSWDYIKKLSMNGLSGIPTELGATSSTYYCDGAYLDTSTSGFRSPLGSGNAYLGDNAGSACFLGNYAPSHATAYLSSPLCETPGDFDPTQIILTA